MANSRQKLKNKTWSWMAKYIKLRDSIEDGIPCFVRCRTCGNILQLGTKNCQAGHYKGRGLGGQSGVYFDERNVYAQCYQCNAHKQGAPAEMREHILKIHGQNVLDELELKHKVNSYTDEEIIGLGLYYKQKYEELLKKRLK